MEEDHIFLNSLLEVLYNDKNLEILRDYNSTLRTLAEWFHKDKFFDVDIYGSGFDSRLQLLHFRESFGDNWRVMHEVTPQTALFVHRMSAILPTNSVEYKENYPLLFYMSPTTANPSLVKLWMSSRTHSLVMRNNYGLPLKESVVVRHDERKIPKFYLSSAAMLKLFRPDRSGNFLLFHRHSLASSYKEEKSHIRVALSVFDFKEFGNMQRAPDGVYALQTLPALHCPDWPEFAQEWVYRKRKWPTKAVVQEAMNQGVHFIPPQSSRTSSLATIDYEGNSGLNNSDIIWAVDLSAAQSVITKNFTKEQGLVLLFSSLLVRADTYRCSVQLVLDKYKEQNVESIPVNNILLHCFLWYYEGLPTDSITEKDLLSKMCIILGKFADCLLAKDCPNYFLPGINLLSAFESRGESIDCYIEYIHGLQTDVGKTCEVLKTCGVLHDDLISSPDSDSAHGNKSPNLLSINITKQLKQKLAKSMEENIKLLALQLYQKLHATDSISSSITKHTDMLSILPKKDQPLFKFIAPLKFFISSSLGSVYAAKAASTLLKKDKKQFKTKAEETLLVSTDSDSISGVVNLANYYYMVGEMENIIECLEPLLKAIHAIKDAECPEFGLDEPFREIWQKREFSHDMMFSSLEKSIVPENVEKCFTLAVNQQLGYIDHPISTFDAKFYAGHLLALAYAHSGQIEFCKGVLLSQELECDTEQPDLNEKRLAAYLNLMADVHLSIECKGEALSLLQRSLMILPNPSNPARWKVLSIKTEKARKYISWGLGVFVVTTATALGYTALKPNALK